MLAQTELLIYGTTRSTNAVVTKKHIAKTALITTDGFPDTLLFKEGCRQNGYDYTLEYPEPYIPRRHTFGLVERIDAEGGVVIPLDEQQACEMLAKIKQQGFEAIAVCLLWSIINPQHEQRIGELIEQHLPGVPYTLSSKLVPVLREYRRASTTAIDASLKPLMQEHLREMEADLRENGYKGEILISTIAGGCVHVEELVDRPIYTVKSGPAMAPIAGLSYSNAEGLGGDVLICDTGGTTFDVGLTRAGRVVETRETWLGPQWEGDLVSISSVDVRSVGAGGGSIAWIDDGGLLRVGPQSAGSIPGPACYGRGGEEPTVTDAAVVLGYFDPDHFLGGRMQLDLEAGRRAIGTVADKLGLSLEETAYSIIRLSSELMIKAISEITINEGFDPRESTLIAGGGAAGLNILMIAEEMGCGSVVLPKTAGALSAAGMQFADIVVDRSRSYITSDAAFDHATVVRILRDLSAELGKTAEQMKQRGMSESYIEYGVEARYKDQVWQLETKVPANILDDGFDVRQLTEAFHRTHEQVFAMRDERSIVELLNWKARLVVKLDRGSKPVLGAVDEHDADPVRTRSAFFGEGGTQVVQIFDGRLLKPGARITGPAIIEEPTTTVVVYPGNRAKVSASGNYILSPTI